MLAGQGFGRWGFIVGNVLMAFGAPVFVTSLVSTVANNRAGLPARNEDIAAIAAGAAFVLAGLMLAVLAGRSRQTSPPLPQRSPQPFGPARLPVRAGDSLGGGRRSNPSPGPSFGLDDYYTPPRGGPVLADDIFEAPAPPREQADVPPQRTPSGAHRNSRHWLGADRFHQPTITGTRSSGTRRRPPAG
jgi:hypothetical protein